LRAVGVTTFIPEISGARAIIEHYKGEPNGRDVVDKYITQGYRGCWVIALGNNDAANIPVGGQPDQGAQIDLLMTMIGDQPVLWVNTRTRREPPERADKHGPVERRIGAGMHPLPEAAGLRLGQ